MTIFIAFFIGGVYWDAGGKDGYVGV